MVGTSLNTGVKTNLDEDAKLMVKAYYYDGSGRDKEIVLGAKLPKLTSEQLLWIDITGREPRDIKHVATLLKLLPDCASDLQKQESCFSLNTYGRYLHFDVTSLKVEQVDASVLPVIPRAVKLDFVIGKSWLVTVHDMELEFLRDFRAQDRGETLIGELTPAALASDLLDWHLGPYLAASEHLEDFCDNLDDRILAKQNPKHDILPEIVNGRRYASELRRLLVPQRSVFYGLSRADVALILGRRADDEFSPLEHHFERTLDVVERARDLVQGSFDLYSTRIAETTNSLIRRLTFISIMLGAIGAVAGIFGMNFDTSYAHTGQFGFWVVVSSLMVLGIAFGILSRSKGWI